MPRTAIITGATSGIGRATALELSRRGWKVCIVARNEVLCKELSNYINLGATEKSYNITCDLSDLSQVKELVEQIIKSNYPPQAIIHNAGVFSVKRKETIDGLENMLVVNFLSRFLMNNLLGDYLISNAPCRIIHIAGAYHKKGSIYFEDPNLKENYCWQEANNQTKLLDILHTNYMAEKFKRTGITFNSLHPGAVYTGSVLKEKDLPVILRLIYRLMQPFFKSPGKGAETPVFLADNNSIEGVSGKYFVSKKERPSAAITYDIKLQKKAFDLACSLVGQRDFEWMKTVKTSE